MTKQPPSSAPVFLAVIGGVGCLGLLCTVGMVVVGVAAIDDAHETEARTRRAMAIGETLHQQEEEPLEEPLEDLPIIDRHVPTHPVSMVASCPRDQQAGVESAIAEAIDVGAPLYNDGNFAGCYHIYEGAALDLERRLPPSCAGIAGALSDGRTRAASLSTPAAQAWAMRDAFDGVLDVLERADGR